MVCHDMISIVGRTLIACEGEVARLSIANRRKRLPMVSAGATVLHDGVIMP